MGNWIANCLRSRTALFNGKSSIPLLSCVCFRDISGLDRSSSSTAKTKQLWAFGLQVHSETHLSCTLSVLYFSVLLLTTYYYITCFCHQSASKQRPFGTLPSLPPVSGDCRLHPLLIPGRHSPLHRLLQLQGVAKFPC